MRDREAASAIQAEEYCQEIKCEDGKEGTDLCKRLQKKALAIDPAGRWLLTLVEQLLDVVEWVGLHLAL